MRTHGSRYFWLFSFSFSFHIFFLFFCLKRCAQCKRAREKRLVSNAVVHQTKRFNFIDIDMNEKSRGKNTNTFYVGVWRGCCSATFWLLRNANECEFEMKLNKKYKNILFGCAITQKTVRHLRCNEHWTKSLYSELRLPRRENECWRVRHTSTFTSWRATLRVCAQSAYSSSVCVYLRQRLRRYVWVWISTRRLSEPECAWNNSLWDSTLLLRFYLSELFRFLWNIFVQK